MLQLSFKFVILTILVVVLSSCYSPAAKIIKIGSDEELVTISSIDPFDWQTVAQKGIDSLLASGALKRDDGSKSIVMISRIRNYTLQHIDTQILTAKVRTAILQSGQGQITSAVGNRSNIDLAVRRMRDKENDDIFNQSTLPQRGMVIAPNMSLSGAIIQQTIYQGRKEESYFSFHLVLTDLTTGLAVWEHTEDVLKQGVHPLL